MLLVVAKFLAWPIIAQTKVYVKGKNNVAGSGLKYFRESVSVVVMLTLGNAHTRKLNLKLVYSLLYFQIVRFIVCFDVCFLGLI